jgi:hypothetical protein
MVSRLSQTELAQHLTEVADAAKRDFERSRRIRRRNFNSGKKVANRNVNSVLRRAHSWCVDFKGTPDASSPRA